MTTSSSRNLILIDEEYGYRSWYVIVDDQKLDEYKARWTRYGTRGLSCLTPVPDVFEDAAEYDDSEPPFDVKQFEKNRIFFAHIHEPEDSYFSVVKLDERGSPSAPSDDDDEVFCARSQAVITMARAMSRDIEKP